MADIWIFGAGGMGISMAVHCSSLGHNITLYSPFAEECIHLRQNRGNDKLLPGIRIADTVTVTDRLDGANRAQFAMIATPSAAVRTICHTLKGQLSEQCILVCVSKGFEPDTLKPLTTVMEEELPANANVILSGPSHAEEISRGIPTTVVSASRNASASRAVQDAFMSEHLRIYINNDVVGVELGGALKNVIALATGILDGMKLGDNPKAALMTRGISEIARLGVAMGGRQETFAGLTGFGDLIVTCTSRHSRNHQAGELIYTCGSVEEALRTVGKTVEGYTASKCAHELAQRYGVEMPIITQVYQVLYEEKQPAQAISDLMNRSKCQEIETIWLK